jgi:hypothetical protein
MEDAQILRLTIRHYQELLKLERHTAETRQRLIELLEEAQEPIALCAPFARSVAIVLQCSLLR